MTLLPFVLTLLGVLFLAMAVGPNPVGLVGIPIGGMLLFLAEVCRGA